MIAPAIAPALDLDPASAELVSFEEVVSEIPRVVLLAGAEEEVERPALVDVVGDVEARTGASVRDAEVELEARVDEEEVLDSVVLVDSSSSSVAVEEARAVVRRVVLLRAADEDSTELLSPAPLLGARVGVRSSSSVDVESGWPGG